MVDTGFIPSHGGYKKLLSYQKSVIIYDATVRFCDRFLKRGDRTVDQMVQAARSGKQNIVEGSKISATSSALEINLVNVARASLEELLEDYTDFLRTRDLKTWEKDSKEAAYVRRLGSKKGVSYSDFKEFIETRPAETVANILICLINQATYLLTRQVRQLESKFVNEGGVRERRTAARRQQRAKDKNANRKKN